MPTEAKLAELPAIESDGRRQRTERTRVAIVEALYELMEEGNLVPTAQELADKAGIGLRTYFRRFKSTEELFECFDAHFRPSYEELIWGGRRTGDLEQRIKNAVQHFTDCFTSQRNIMLSTHTFLWRSPVISRLYTHTLATLRESVEGFLPELKELSKDDREAAHAVISFEMWHRLKVHQNLSKKKSREIMEMVLRALLIAT